MSVYFPEKKSGQSLSQTFIANESGLHEIYFRYKSRSSTYSGGIVRVKIGDNEVGYVQTDDGYWRTAAMTATLTAGETNTLTFVHDLTNSKTNANSDTPLASSMLDLVSVVKSDDENLILNADFDAGTILGGQTHGKQGGDGVSSPFWTMSGNTGLSLSGGPWVSSAIDAGTYAAYLQATASANSSLSQSFSVAKAGVFKLSFNHACRPNYASPETIIRIHRGTDTSGAVVWEKSISTSSSTAWDTFEKEISIYEAGDYTLEFYREAGSGSANSNGGYDNAHALDNISLTRERNLPGFIIVFR